MNRVSLIIPVLCFVYHLLDSADSQCCGQYVPYPFPIMPPLPFPALPRLSFGFGGGYGDYDYKDKDKDKDDKKFKKEVKIIKKKKVDFSFLTDKYDAWKEEKEFKKMVKLLNKENKKGACYKDCGGGHQ